MILDLLQRLAYGMRLVNAVDRQRLGMALEEAVLNAMYHGNLELTSDQLTEVGYDLSDPDAENIVD